MVLEDTKQIRFNLFFDILKKKLKLYKDNIRILKDNSEYIFKKESNNVFSKYLKNNFCQYLNFNSFQS